MSYNISPNNITRLVTVSSMGQSIDVNYPTDIHVYTDMSTSDWELYLSPFITQLPKPYTKILNASIQPTSGIQGDNFTISWECIDTPSINISGTNIVDGTYPIVGNVSFKQCFNGIFNFAITTNDDSPEQINLIYTVEKNGNLLKVDTTPLFTLDNPYGLRLEVE